jgi:hypothetical protein
MSPDKIRFPSSLPPDAQQIWTDYYSLAKASSSSVPFPEALEVLQRLAMRLEMKEAWAELKHFPNVSPSDLIAMTFMVWLLATHNRLLRKFPQFASNRDGELAIMTRKITDALRDPAIRAEASIADATLRELKCLAAFFERRAENSDVRLRIAPPPTKAGARNADQIAFVYQMCDWQWRQPGRRPYALVAILANVAFNVSDKQWDADRVKHCLRSRSRKKVGQVREH